MTVRVPDDPAALLRLAADLARSAADLVWRARQDGPVLATSKSTITDLVTEYDRASERLIADGLLAARPNDALVGEEGTDRPGTSGITWIVDPIDGTTNFRYGLPGYAVSIAAHDGDGGLVGAVAVPTLNECYTARRGAGAWCNDRPIRASTTTELARAVVATGFSYSPERRRAQARRVAAIIERIADIRRFGAAAADLCYAAAGRVDVYFEEYLNPWDLAAGAVIATEAGCRVGSLQGGPPEPGSVLVAGPALFDAVVELLAWADTSIGPGHHPGHDGPGAASAGRLDTT